MTVFNGSLLFPNPEDDKMVGGEDKDGGAKDDVKTAATSQAKGKKNAYSNSVQKMTCPFCPRVFPWASSLQRHMLTHTGTHLSLNLFGL